MKTAPTLGILLKEYLDGGDCAAIRTLEKECIRRGAIALKLELDYGLFSYGVLNFRGKRERERP